ENARCWKRLSGSSHSERARAAHREASPLPCPIHWGTRRHLPEERRGNARREMAQLCLNARIAPSAAGRTTEPDLPAARCELRLNPAPPERLRLHTSPPVAFREERKDWVRRSVPKRSPVAAPIRENRYGCSPLEKEDR